MNGYEVGNARAAATKAAGVMGTELILGTNQVRFVTENLGKQWRYWFEEQRWVTTVDKDGKTIKVFQWVVIPESPRAYSGGIAQGIYGREIVYSWLWCDDVFDFGE